MRVNYIVSQLDSQNQIPVALYYYLWLYNCVSCKFSGSSSNNNYRENGVQISALSSVFGSYPSGSKCSNVPNELVQLHEWPFTWMTTSVVIITIDSYSWITNFISFHVCAAAVGLVSCITLYGAAVSGLILGVVTFLMSLLCCFHFCATDNVIIRCFCCSTATILLLTFFGALISNTVFVAENINFIYGDNNCQSPVVAVAVMGMSWVMLLLFGLFCLCSCCLCLNSKMSEE